MDSNLIREMTRTLASEDFDGFAEAMPALEREIKARLAVAADAAAREQVMQEVASLNRRWLSLARSLRAHMADQLQSIHAEAGYLAAMEQSPIISTTA